LRRHGNSVHGVSFSHNSQFLASASDDNTAILWDLKNLNQAQALLQDGCKWVNDYLATNTGLKAKERHLCDEIDSTRSGEANVKVPNLIESGRSILESLRSGISSLTSK
jgi:WD40 repeat protein